MNFEKIKIIVNPVAGARRDQRRMIDSIKSFFSDIGSNYELCFTSRRGEGLEFAQNAVEEKVDAVIVVGGDGTINEVGSALVNTDVVIGIIPCGSGNGLARTLGIPAEAVAACKLVMNGQIVSIDVGKVNDGFFFLVAGVGFDALVGKKFDEMPTRGPLPYFYLSVKEFLTYKPEEIAIHFDERSLQVRPFVIAVANGQQYGNNALIAPGAKLNDGLLDLCIVHRLSVLQLPEALPKLFKGKIESYSDAEFHKTQNLVIERQQSDYVNIDGEPVLEAPVVKVSMLPKALKIVAPKNSPGLVK
ncbi:YegS/Rv2252/BmrU family lipid kinase [candidate division KSB1 bacterium]|nr:YegS/Rv2252/BmrU family lipid kinase [candidate division KSB1 bacterium]